MAAMMSITAMTIDAILPALGAIGSELQVSHPNQAQYIISFIFAGMAMGQLVCGPLSDALGRKTVLYMTMSLYLAGSIICFLAPNISVMLLGRLLQGISTAGPYVTTMSIVRDKFSGRLMARIMSLVMMIFIMVPTLAPSIGQLVMFVASWRYIFIFYILYAGIILTFVAFGLEETLPKERRIPFTLQNLKNGFASVLSHRQTVMYILAIACIFSSLIGYLNSCQQIFQVQFGVGKWFVVYFGGLALTIGVSSLTNSRIVEAYGMRFICIRALLVIITSSAIFLGLHLIVDITVWMFVIYAACLFFSFGFLMGNLNTLAIEPMGHIAGLASAVIGSTSAIIAMIIGTTIGQMYNNNLIPIALSFFALGMIALTLVLNAERQSV